ncbi:Uncharacterised protein [Vibrio cholerae]|nr:Uncharacterised protein [Vibrio cholerae]CSI57656.1 Uncharacterised protein [Vibrio cholerae]
MWQNSPSRIEQNGKIHYVVVCRTQPTDRMGSGHSG